MKVLGINEQIFELSDNLNEGSEFYDSSCDNTCHSCYDAN